MIVKRGLKVWSVNGNYIPEAKRLFDKGIYEYIELYVVPNSYDVYAEKWKRLNIPIQIHAPHVKHTLNLSLRGSLRKNRELTYDTFKFADLFQSEYIVFHPGVNGSIDEVIDQVNSFNDNRIIIENMPYRAIDGKSVCVGHGPDDIKRIMNMTNCGFCLDIGHAIYSANSLNENRISLLMKYLEMEPKVIHFMDGEWDGMEDSHLNLGMGSFPLNEILSLVIDKSVFFSLETGKRSQTSLDDFALDCKLIQKMF